MAVESLEKREVLSDLSGLSPPRARAAAVESDQAIGPGFVPMFNGTNTAGWFNPFDTGRAVAKNGQILLMGAKKFFLVSQQSYTNFILTADIMIPAQGRSGLQFRSSDGFNFVNGYKADVVTSDRIWSGGLWSQSRGWLARPAQKPRVIPGQWNHYEVDAIGDQIRIVVNNTVTVDTDNNLFTTGHIALQDHGTKDAVYRFKNVEIENLGGEAAGGGSPSLARRPVPKQSSFTRGGGQIIHPQNVFSPPAPTGNSGGCNDERQINREAMVRLGCPIPFVGSTATAGACRDRGRVARGAIAAVGLRRYLAGSHD